ncbi:hypothetical protein M0805_001768 [Coniferiporia weirii]|nr:hypothetical protein M0805_001768 [Coniferiporia weirii]
MAADFPNHAIIHPVSAAAFNTRLSELYNKYRPSYDSKVLSHIRKAVGGKEELNIVEIGCGTGIFTRDILAHPEWSKSIAEIKCMDPNEGMRAVFLKTLSDPRVNLSNGTFEDTGVADGWADLIVSATAFHWCLDLEAAMNEFVRVLKPSGTICFLWILEDGDRTPWVRQLLDLYEPYQEIGKASRWMDRNNWQRIYDLPVYKENFHPPEDSTILSITTETPESATLRFLTWSAVASLPENGKQKLREEVEAIVSRGDGMVWINEGEAHIEVPVKTPITIFQRKYFVIS